MCQIKSMTDKTQIIVTAATNMFARYGYAKTTMGDIASEAGVARQTVYNAFPGKDEILRAVVRQAGEDTYAAVMKAWSKTDSIDEKLSIFHELGPLKWFEAIRAAPDWAELIDGMHNAASEVMAAQDAQWRHAFATVLRTNATERPDVVDFFYSASLNAKYGVEDVQHLRTRLATIKNATLALLKA